MGDVRADYQAILERVREACGAAGRAPEAVRLVAVSKKQPIERLRAAYEAGCRDFGENYVQELERKRSELPADVRWHMIGHLQTNKVKRALGASLIHGVDSERVAQALGRAAAEAGRVVDVLVEVNVGGEETKSGVSVQDAEPLVRAVLSIPSLRLRGLMCIPPEGDARPLFRRLAELRKALERATGTALPELSMGMSADFEDAILEGATLVRVGTAIFGARVG